MLNFRLVLTSLAMLWWAFALPGRLAAQESIDELSQSIPIPNKAWIQLALWEVGCAESRQSGSEVVIRGSSSTSLLLSDEEIHGLALLVAPLRAMQIKAGEARGPQYEELMTIIRQWEDNGELAEQICSVLGPERVAIRSREYRLSALFGATNPSLERLTGTILLRPAMSSFLSLTNSQLAQLRTLARELDRERQKLMDELYNELLAISREQMDQYLLAIDGPQRDIVKRTIGVPIDWSRFASLAEAVALSSIQPDASFSVMIVPGSVSRSISQQQLELHLVDSVTPVMFESQTGFMVEDYFFFRLLESQAAIE